MFYILPPKNTEPFRQFQQVLTNNEIASVIKYVNTLDRQEGLIGGAKNGGASDEKVRRSKINFLQINDDTKWLYNKLSRFIYEMNDKFFGYDLHALQEIQYTEYHGTQQGVYHDHVDWAGGTALPRKLSMSLQLTDSDDYEGGNLEIKLTSQNPYIASRTKGDAVLFPSFLLHGVTPVTSGIRRSLVIWVMGPEFR